MGNEGKWEREVNERGGKWESGVNGREGLGDRYVYGRGSYMQERDK